MQSQDPAVARGPWLGYGEDGRFALPPGLADHVAEELPGLARNARTLFSSWAARAGLQSGTAEMATVG